jgi:hypothetical protein
MSTLLSSLMRVDLSLGKLAGANTFVRRPILLQTAVLWLKVSLLLPELLRMRYSPVGLYWSAIVMVCDRN